MKKTLVVLGVCSLAVAPALASAQESPTVTERTAPEEGKSWFNRTKAAPSRALELNASTGYTQGFGPLQPGIMMQDVASQGVSGEIGLGYRLTPHWALGVSGQFNELMAERGAAARGATGTLAVQYHFNPYKNVDPWIELGAGYRGLWEVPGQNAPAVDRHGLQLGRLRVGADFRASENVALGPFIGADANYFVVQDGVAIDNPRVSTFVMAGLTGRFDIGGVRTVPEERDITPEYIGASAPR
jgi:outer membrane protein W